MFDVSFTELLVIGVVALVVIGPERLPKVARTVGHLVGRAQRYVNDVKSDIQREVELDDLRKLKDQMQDAAQTVKSSFSETEASLRKPLESFEQDTMAALNEAKSLDTIGAQPAPEQLTSTTAEGLETPAPAVEIERKQATEFVYPDKIAQAAAPAAEPAPLPSAVAPAAPASAPAAAPATPVAQAPAPKAQAAPAPVTISNSPSAIAQVAAANPTPAAELANAFETPSTPKQLMLDGVVSGPIPEALSHAERAAINASAQAAAATPKPGTPT